MSTIHLSLPATRARPGLAGSLALGATAAGGADAPRAGAYEYTVAMRARRTRGGIVALIAVS